MSKLSLLFNGSSRLAWPAALLAVAAMAAAPAQAATVASSHVAGPLRSEGVVNVKALAAAAARSAGQASSGLVPAQKQGPSEYRAIPRRTFKPLRPFSASAELARAPHATAQGKLVTAAVGPQSFVGLDHYDQRILADNNNQFSLEPPDQALAVGSGFVVEVVNNALQVYKPNGTALLAAPVSMNRFMGQISEYNRTTGEFGPFLSDPRAYYDWPTGRFIVAEWATLNDAAGVPLDISVQFVAVSQTSDPTGGWFVYSYETTNSNEPGCKGSTGAQSACLPDFGQLGGDGSGIYITSSLFSLVDFHFAGTKIYALPKAAMEAGFGGPIGVSSFPLMTDDFTVFPTIAPPHGRFALENKGTEYFVEGTADLTDDGIGTSMRIFAISNTNSLATDTPNLTLQSISLPSQSVDANMPHSLQDHGPRPLGGCGPGGLCEPTPKLDSGDGRVGSTPYYVNGTIWAVSGTAVAEPDGFLTDGVAWFKFQTSAANGPLDVSIADQGIISAPKHNFLTYPAIGINAAGTGGIGVTITSAHRFPSTATIALPTFSSPTITVSGVGAQPDDGFTAYAAFGGGGTGRWGDYGAASVDGFGNVWFANEYIPDSATHPRSSLANWGTFVTRVAQ